MTREVAIKAIQDFIGWFKEDSLIRKALEMAIKALSQVSEIEENIIKYMKKYPNHVGNTDFWEGFYACRNVVLQLDDEEYAPKEQEPCDAIIREELLKAISTWDKFGVDDTNSLFRLDNLSLPHYVPYIHYDDVIKCIKGMPSVTQKSGKWIKKEDDTCWWYACSECEQEPLKNRWNDDDVLSAFCPNCGAKMESEDEVCKGCYYNDGKAHAECVLCDKAESEE